MSRWMIPEACAVCSAAQDLQGEVHRALDVEPPALRARSCARSQPSRNSITRYGAPVGIRPTSNTLTTWSLSICEAATPSFTKRSTAPWSASTAGLMNFSATGARRSMCVALATAPIPPSPSSCSTRYLPSSTSPGCGYGLTGVYWGWDIERAGVSVSVGL